MLVITNTWGWGSSGHLWSTRQREERSGAGLARGALALLTDLRPSSPPWGAREGRVRGPFRFGLFLVGLGRDLELECVRGISLLRNPPRTSLECDAPAADFFYLLVGCA